MNVRIVVAALLAGAGIFLTGCKHEQPSVASAQTPAQVQPTPAVIPTPMPLPANVLHIDSAKALQYTREIVAFGPRPVGSEAHGKLENYIKSKLKGVSVQEDKFEIVPPAPLGKFTGHNFLAKFPGKKNGIVVIAGHYDTKYNIPNFVGANDGGSSAALLLALADSLRGKSNDGYSVWLLWNDAEEAFVQWTDTDSVYGARYQAGKWKQDGTATKIMALINVDMIGDADLNIEDETLSDERLRHLAYQAATNLGYQSHFFAREAAVVDDHLPFKAAGIPAIDLIDFDYGYNNVFWHTANDTMDKVSAESLKITGDTVLEMVRLLNGQ